jgi:hypothetical protein
MRFYNAIYLYTGSAILHSTGLYITDLRANHPQAAGLSPHSQQSSRENKQAERLYSYNLVSLKPTAIEK